MPATASTLVCMCTACSDVLSVIFSHSYSHAISLQLFSSRPSPAFEQFTVAKISRYLEPFVVVPLFDRVTTRSSDVQCFAFQYHTRDLFLSFKLLLSD